MVRDVDEDGLFGVGGCVCRAGDGLRARSVQRDDLSGTMTSIEGVVVPQLYPTPPLEKSSSLNGSEVHDTLMHSSPHTFLLGGKLSGSSVPGVRELCNTFRDVHLVQLLDARFLHADPHLGNLIRTPCGKIRTIDFGLMTTIAKTQRANLATYIIANLTTTNWTGSLIPSRLSDSSTAIAPIQSSWACWSPTQDREISIFESGTPTAIQNAAITTPGVTRAVQQGTNTTTVCCRIEKTAAIASPLKFSLGTLHGTDLTRVATLACQATLTSPAMWSEKAHLRTCYNASSNLSRRHCC